MVELNNTKLGKFSNGAQINNQKRFFIHTLGCKVNQYESQAMREALLKAGFKECISKEMADIYIVNTCTVTERTDRESRHWLGHFHKANPKAEIVVTGCYVEKDADKVSFLPGISHIVHNVQKTRIADILAGTDILTPGVSQKTRPQGSEIGYRWPSITGFKDHTKAFVKIQDGCENTCAYCKVPLVRGASRSRPINDILDEVGVLAANGYKEIVLTGICLGAWGKDLFPSELAGEIGLDGPVLADVLKAVDRLSDDFRVRISSIEPKYVTDDLIDIMSRSKRFCRHLHIPLQSGDDEVLRRMKRPYATSDYRTLIGKIRSKMDDIAITTDALIGFPGETDANFKNMVNFIKEIIPARLHIFTFSRREGTPAYDMRQEVGRDVLKRRFHELKVAGLAASFIYRRRFLENELDVLVETRRDRATGYLTGYSSNYIKVLFEGPDSLMGRIVPVRITDLTLAYTIGEHHGK